MKPLLAWLLAVALPAAGSACAQEPLFGPAPGSPVPVAGDPRNVALGDLNKDGKRDLIVASGKVSR